MNEIENGLAVFCMASYGEGDPTDNAQNFSDWLKDGESDLSGLNYAVRFIFVYFVHLFYKQGRDLCLCI